MNKLCTTISLWTKFKRKKWNIYTIYKWSINCYNKYQLIVPMWRGRTDILQLSGFGNYLSEPSTFISHACYIEQKTNSRLLTLYGHAQKKKKKPRCILKRVVSLAWPLTFIIIASVDGTKVAKWREAGRNFEKSYLQI